MQGITTICAREEKFFLASLKRSELPQVSHQFLQLFLIERERDDFFFFFY